MVVIMGCCKYGLGPTNKHVFRIKGINTKCTCLATTDINTVFMILSSFLTEVTQ